jgi:LuxR family maltose regulon positive regulatory protein
VEDEPSYAQELEHVIFARTLISLGTSRGNPAHLRDAQRLLMRLLEAAQRRGWVGKEIEVLLLEALAEAALGDKRRALARLGHALSLGETEGYVRIFLDEGEPMVALLRLAASRGIAPEYAGRLITAHEEVARAPSSARALPSDVSLMPIEPLSERELDVLRLLNSDLSGPEIARRLIVSVNTVKTHRRHIYEKLGVHSRFEAVQRAQELDLL